MIMANTCTQHFLLPINICASILKSNTIFRGVLTQFCSSSHIVLLQDIVECHITIIGNIGFILTTLLGCDDDNTVGSLRTIDSGSSSITQYVDALDIIRRYNRDINTRNTIYNIVWRHSTCTQCRSTTQRDGW